MKILAKLYAIRILKKANRELSRLEKEHVKVIKEIYARKVALNNYYGHGSVSLLVLLEEDSEELTIEKFEIFRLLDRQRKIKRDIKQYKHAKKTASKKIGL